MEKEKRKKKLLILKSSPSTVILAFLSFSSDNLRTKRRGSSFRFSPLNKKRDKTKEHLLILGILRENISALTKVGCKKQFLIPVQGLTLTWKTLQPIFQPLKKTKILN